MIGGKSEIRHSIAGLKRKGIMMNNQVPWKLNFDNRIRGYVLDGKPVRGTNIFFFFFVFHVAKRVTDSQSPWQMGLSHWMGCGRFDSFFTSLLRQFRMVEQSHPKIYDQSTPFKSGLCTD